MGISKSYNCDGPECKAVTEHTPNTSFPADWPRVTITFPGEKPRSGAFHEKVCALRWTNDAYEARSNAAVGDEPVGGEPVPS